MRNPLVLWFLLLAVAAILIVAGSPASAHKSQDRCVEAGCSGQLCISQAELDAGGGLTICDWQPEYACLDYSRCGHYGTRGECAWRETRAYEACLAGVDAAQNSCGPIPLFE